MLSIIVPFVNEHPQIIFTLQALFNEIKDIDAEIITIDNFTKEVENQAYEDPQQICPYCFEKIETYRRRDSGGFQVQQYAKTIPNLTALSYTDKLSHWQAKNHGVRNGSKGSVLLFVDAHVIPYPGSIKAMYDMFKISQPDGTFHLPLTYMLDLKKQLKYRLDVDPSRSYYGYSFAGYQPGTQPEAVPCMSTCGMMMSRELFDTVGGWPEELGIYGGGENYMNYVLAVLGKQKWVCPVGPLYHYAAPRGYYYNYDDFVRNRAIAATMITGDIEEAKNYLMHCQGDKDKLQEIYDSIQSKQSLLNHLVRLAPHRQLTIEQWLNTRQNIGQWDGKPSTREYVS